MSDIPIPNCVLNDGLHARSIPHTTTAANGSTMIHIIQRIDRKFIYKRLSLNSYHASRVAFASEDSDEAANYFPAFSYEVHEQRHCDQVQQHERDEEGTDLEKICEIRYVNYSSARRVPFHCYIQRYF